MSKFFYVLGVLIMMMSCGKDIDQFIPNDKQDVVGDISRLKSRLKEDISGPISYTLSVPCFGLKAFEIDKDVVIEIPAGFVDLDKYPCTNGFFDVKVTVLDSKGEILAAGIPTMSENKLLESRVELNIEILSGTSHVRLAHGKKIRILVNDPDPRERMELFYGEGDQWRQADGNPEKWDNVTNDDWWIQTDSSQNPITGVGYQTFSDSIDWVNVDVYFQIPEELRTPVCVDLPEGFTNTNTNVFMVFDDYRSITLMTGDSTKRQFCEHYGSTPIGFRTTFVVISERGEGNYYFATKKTTITANLTETITPLKTPYEEIRQYIMGL
ncbi:MAG TPA: hypothetical protein VFG10_00840 [Saprospiraceae bacterium]|nr:hypothetical protein [Saprospiraceae bacterium]